MVATSDGSKKAVSWWHCICELTAMFIVGMCLSAVIQYFLLTYYYGILRITDSLGIFLVEFWAFLGHILLNAFTFGFCCDDKPDGFVIAYLILFTLPYLLDRRLATRLVFFFAVGGLASLFMLAHF